MWRIWCTSAKRGPIVQWNWKPSADANWEITRKRACNINKLSVRKWKLECWTMRLMMVNELYSHAHNQLFISRAPFTIRIWFPVQPPWSVTCTNFVVYTFAWILTLWPLVMYYFLHGPWLLKCNRKNELIDETASVHRRLHQIQIMQYSDGKMEMAKISFLICIYDARSIATIESNRFYSPHPFVYFPFCILHQVPYWLHFVSVPYRWMVRSAA